MRRLLAFILGVLLVLLGGFAGATTAAAGEAAAANEVIEPTTEAEPAPSKTTEPAPAKTTEPAPAKTTEPAPAKTTEPAPAKTTEPATSETRPPYGHFDVVEKCPADGPAVLVKLWTGPHGTGTITFTVAIDGKTVWDVALEPGKATSKTFPLPAGAGTHTVTVSVDGKELGTEDVKPDCGTPAPPTPEAEITYVCLETGGARVTVTMSVSGVGPPVEFTVSIEGQDPKKVEVTPGDSKTAVYPLAEGPGTADTLLVTVSVNGEELDKADVPVDCVTEAIPRATFTAVCVSEGGPSVDVAVQLRNDAIGTPGHPGLPAIFTLFVDNQAQTVEGETSWSVGAGEERQPLIVRLPQRSQPYVFEVRVGSLKITKEVSADCRESNPQVTAEVICGAAKVTFTNELASGGEDAIFHVIVDGVEQPDVVVAPNATETRPYTFAEDSGPHSIVVKDDLGNTLETIEVVTTDCLAAYPAVSAVVVCGAATVTFTNDVPAGQPGGEDAIFHVIVDAGTPVDVIVKPDTPQTIPYTFAEDTGIHTVAVENDAGEPLIETIQVETDCTQLDKTADPAEGTPVQAPEPITYSVKITNSSTVQSATGDVVDTLPVGVKVVAGTISDGGTLSADEKTITWKDVSLEAGGSKTFTFEVEVTAGFGTPQLLNKSTWLGNSDQTIHPVLAISGDAVALCIEDAPYYTLTVNSQNHELFSSQDVTVDWYRANAQGQPIDAQGNPTTDPTQFVRAINPLTNEPVIQNYTLDANGQLNVTALWPGAAVDADGNATQWPGWILNSDGTWTQVDDGGVREHAVIVVTVNPTLSGIATYPPSASGCANPTNTPPENPPNNPPELPKTGGNLAPQLALALMMLISGGALKGGSLLARRR